MQVSDITRLIGKYRPESWNSNAKDVFDFIGGSKEEAGEYVVGLERYAYYAMSSLLLLNHLCTFFFA